MNTPLDHTYLPLEISIRLTAETRHTAFSSGPRNRSTFSSTPFSNNTRGSPPAGNRAQPALRPFIPLDPRHLGAAARRLPPQYPFLPDPAPGLPLHPCLLLVSRAPHLALPLALPLVPPRVLLRHHIGLPGLRVSRTPVLQRFPFNRLHRPRRQHPSHQPRLPL
ncbi:hypothetical protein B0H11DRAFT_563661 [Mycena galericulata]|nr:hypothetical protein B0H11DRAFT_563661 [Mycena galericulata]